MKEVKLKHFVGLFDKLRFSNFIQSPIRLVPKGEEGKDTRLIFNLSYSRNGRSVNSEKPKEICSVKYNDLGGVIKLCVEAGKGCFIAKSDMKSAFCNLPIKPEDWKWLVLFAFHPVTNQKWYIIDKCPPFGASISCTHFQRFSNSIAHIFKRRTCKSINNYLDDFLFAALIKAVCVGHVNIFLDICKIINFPVALDKTFWGMQLLVFWGILINTITQTISISDDKRNKVVYQIHAIISKQKMTVLQMQNSLVC